jgi:HK97 gp10 family phage protein
MPGSVKIDGAQRLTATLNRASDDLGKMQRPDATAAAIVAAVARARAPWRTGRLHTSIRADVSEGVGRVVAAAPYAGYVEFGDPSRSIPPRPFLGGAAEFTKPAVIDVYGDDLNRIVSRVKGA